MFAFPKQLLAETQNTAELRVSRLALLLVLGLCFLFLPSTACPWHHSYAQHCILSWTTQVNSDPWSIFYVETGKLAFMGLTNCLSCSET